MRSNLWAAMALGVLTTPGLGPAGARGQTYYVPSGSPGSNPWSGYALGYPWGGYVPGAVWIVGTPGTPAGVPAAPAPAAGVPPGPTSAPALATTPTPAPLTYPAPRPTRPRFYGVSSPVGGPNPYADGRLHPYYGYGAGRKIPLIKPWLPGSPGGL